MARPPEYLLRLSPRLYEAERQRIAAKFDEAVQLAESAFVAEFGKLVTHLTERLHDGGPEGERKVFRDSAIENLQAFFGRFRNLSIHSNAQLDELVETARRAVQGVSAQNLRDSDALRRHVAGQMATVTASLDGLLVEAPRRRLLRSAAAVAEVA